jgi:hypothetical protein
MARYRIADSVREPTLCAARCGPIALAGNGAKSQPRCHRNQVPVEGRSGLGRGAGLPVDRVGPQDICRAVSLEVDPGDQGVAIQGRHQLARYDERVETDMKHNDTSNPATKALFRLDAENLPVWVAPLQPEDEYFDDHGVCEHGTSDEDPCTGPMFFASVENDIALYYCETHVYEGLTPVTQAEYDVLVAAMS